MAELPEREQACPTFDTLYMLAKKLEAGQPAHACRYTPSSKAYRDKHRHYVVPMGWVAALEEEGSVLSDLVTGEDSESKVEAVGGINVHPSYELIPVGRVTMFHVWVAGPFCSMLPPSQGI